MMNEIKYDGKIFYWLATEVFYTQRAVVKYVNKNGHELSEGKYRNWKDDGMEMRDIPWVCNMFRFSPCYLFAHGGIEWSMKDFRQTSEKEWNDVSLYYPNILRGYANEKGKNLIVKELNLLNDNQFELIAENRGDELTNFNTGLYCNVMNRLGNCSFGIFNDYNIPRRYNPVTGLYEAYVPGVDFKKLAEKYPDNIYIRAYMKGLENQMLKSVVISQKEENIHLEEEIEDLLLKRKE